MDAVVGKDRLPTFTDRDSLPYVEAICKELFRWMPIVPLGRPLIRYHGTIYLPCVSLSFKLFLIEPPTTMYILAIIFPRIQWYDISYRKITSTLSQISFRSSLMFRSFYMIPMSTRTPMSLIPIALWALIQKRIPKKLVYLALVVVAVRACLVDGETITSF